MVVVIVKCSASLYFTRAFFRTMHEQSYTIRLSSDFVLVEKLARRLRRTVGYASRRYVTIAVGVATLLHRRSEVLFH